MKIFLHIGEAKCASTSIQGHFKKHHTYGNFTYGVVMNDGTMLFSEQLQYRPCPAQSTYLQFDKTPESFKKNLNKSLLECSKSFDILLLSSESWAERHERIMELSSIFSPHNVEVIYILRPPVQWHNSAWWQWVNWDPNIKSIDDWLEKSNTADNFLTRYLTFEQAPFINKVHLLSLQANIVEQVYNIIDLEYTFNSIEKYNVSSSAEVLYFLSLNKNLRPIHGPDFENLLNRYVKKGSPTPWVLSRENIETILSKSKEACLELAKYISNENILENPLWWNIVAYEKKLLSYSKDINLPYSTVLDMLLEAYITIKSLDQRVARLRVFKQELEQKDILSEKNSQLLYCQKIFDSTKPYARPLMRLRYLRYRILSELTFGKTRIHYKSKKSRLKTLLTFFK